MLCVSNKGLKFDSRNLIGRKQVNRTSPVFINLHAEFGMLKSHLKGCKLNLLMLQSKIIW